MNNELIIRFTTNEMRKMFLDSMGDLEDKFYEVLTDRSVNVESIVVKENSSSPNYEGEIPMIIIEGNMV